MSRRRILGLDYGTKTVGVAVSDGLGITAQELETIFRPKPDKLRRTLARIEEICREYDVEKIVLGLPLNMNDTEGFRVSETYEFKSLLQRRVQLPVIMMDERLTTVEAEQILKESGVRRENRKSVIDQIAAAIILQTYLDSQNKSGCT